MGGMFPDVQFFNRFKNEGYGIRATDPLVVFEAQFVA